MSAASDDLSRFRGDAAAQPVAADIVRQAATHFVQMQSHPDDASVAEACNRWRAAHPQHETAWRQVCALIALPGAEQGISGPAARSAIEHVARQRGRRRFLALGLTAGAAGTLAWTTQDVSTWRVAFADYRSATGERRQVLLDDGAVLLLNTGTAVNVQDDGNLRRVILLSGEVMVTSSTQPTRRPLRVDTRYGTVTPIGTRFSVRDTGDGYARVALFEGQLRLQPRHGDPVVLDAGMGADIREDGVTAKATLDLSAASWTQGVLMAERMPLAQCLAELARYRRGIVRCDRDIALLPISGNFPLDRSDQALALIARVLDLQLVYRTRYWVTLTRG